jgi:high-affinity Fe2+/Pb2+ permease
MNWPLKVLKLLVVALMVGVFLAALGGNVALKRQFLIACFFAISCLGFYTYAWPSHVSEGYARQSKVSLWMSGGIAYNSPEKAKFFGLIIGVLGLLAGILALVNG